MKHFENLWEEAEALMKDDDIDHDQLADRAIKNFKTLMDDWHDTQETEEILGEVLLDICCFTERKGVNSWTALENAMNELRIKRLDPDLAEEEINDKIDAWHDSDSELELHEWLGMTWDEYNTFIKGRK